MRSRIRSFLAVALVATANTALAEEVDVSIRKSATIAPAATTSWSVAVPTTTDEARELQRRQQLERAAYPRPAAQSAPQGYPTTTDLARAQSQARQAEAALRSRVRISRRIPRVPTTTDEARGLY